MHDMEPGAAQQPRSYSWHVLFKLCGQILAQKASPDKACCCIVLQFKSAEIVSALEGELTCKYSDRPPSRYVTCLTLLSADAPLAELARLMTEPKLAPDI
ncbi:TPA: hypothetical protein ACH3X1_006675 [Trebouxia sp. C0004]